MKRITILSLIVLAPITAGCNINFIISGEPGSGVSGTENREIGEFKKVSFAGSGKINIKCGKKPSLEITTDDNLLELIETDVENGTLTISPIENIKPTIGPNFELTTEQIDGVSLAGSGDITIRDASGETLKLSVAGSGNFKVDGVVENVELEIAGSGDADLSELVAKNVSISIAGSGGATVNAINQLDVSVAGSGDVSYIGSPSIKKSIMGSGSVRKMKGREGETKAEADDDTSVSPSIEDKEDAATDDDDLSSDDDEDD